ncbi:MAG: hypothetical protein ABIL58_18470 [Pseudomonadota bacterium]
MRKHELYYSHHDFFEYHGNTEIMRIRRRGEKIVRQDWIVFDTVEAAMVFFNTKCGAFIGNYSGDCRKKLPLPSPAL